MPQKYNIEPGNSTSCAKYWTPYMR